jgi:hypothetical protein
MVNSCGTRVGTVWIVSQAKDKKHALESLDRCIVSGYWELKRKFLINVAFAFGVLADLLKAAELVLA